MNENSSETKNGNEPADPEKPKRSRGRPRSAPVVNLPPQPKFNREGVELEEALKALGIDLNKVMLAPKFTDLLMQSRDGLPGVLEAMRYSRSDVILKFLALYDSQPDKLKAIIPWEAWCIKAELSIPHILGEVILALREHSANAVRIMAITYHPNTVWTRIQQAQTPLGHRERQALDIALGMVPTPRGPTIIERYYGPGSRPDAEIGMKTAMEIPVTATPPPEPPKPEPHLPIEPVVIPAEPEDPPDPEEIEFEAIFPDSARTIDLLNS